MNGRDDTTTFLPLDFRIDGQSRDSCPKVGQYLTRDQTRYIYKKVETGEMINTDTIQQEIEQEKQLKRIDDNVTCKGIWVILGLLLLGSTLDISTLDSPVWSTQVFEYPREYLSA